MVVFQPNRPITTTEPVVRVDGGLPPGRYRFQLVVVDDDGTSSLPSERIITILERPG